jgi:hypothetical protein|tara:strand:- start:623 stop:1075 length:453 start_codon:yes stop_codon:yes gene_type:complete
MAITQAIANSFKKELLEGKHDFSAAGGDTFKLALYVSTATLNSTTTDYTASGEVSPKNGQYVTGGSALVNAGTSLTTGTAKVNFNTLSFTGVTLTAAGALIYNTTTGAGSGTTDAVVILSFGGDKTATSGTFTIQFPPATNSSAIIRISG